MTTRADAGVPAPSLAGWIEAVLYAVCIGIAGVAYAVAFQWGAHVVVFILLSMVISSVALLAIVGAAPDWRQIVRHWMTWFVGTTHILMEASYFMMLVWLAPAEASLITRFAVPMALVMGYLLFRRWPNRLGLAGVAIASLSVFAYAVTLDAASQGGGVVFGLIAALLINMRGFASEQHPYNRAARTVAEKMRVTGHVIMVTATAGIALTAGLMAVIGAGLLPPTALVLHAPTLVLSLVVGAGLFTAMVYLMFSSTLKIRAENFIATGAFMPLTTLLAQHVAVGLGLMALPVFDWRLAPAMAGLMLGVVLMIAATRR
jgi:hypothetical protein